MKRKQKALPPMDESQILTLGDFKPLAPSGQKPQKRIPPGSVEPRKWFRITKPQRIKAPEDSGPISHEEWEACQALTMAFDSVASGNTPAESIGLAPVEFEPLLRIIAKAHNGERNACLVLQTVAREMVNALEHASNSSPKLMGMLASLYADWPALASRSEKHMEGVRNYLAGLGVKNPIGYGNNAEVAKHAAYVVSLILKWQQFPDTLETWAGATMDAKSKALEVIEQERQQLKEAIKNAPESKEKNVIELKINQLIHVAASMRGQEMTVNGTVRDKTKKGGKRPWSRFEIVQRIKSDGYSKPVIRQIINATVTVNDCVEIEGENARTDGIIRNEARKKVLSQVCTMLNSS